MIIPCAYSSYNERGQFDTPNNNMANGSLRQQIGLNKQFADKS
jgi:hypothetical protein